jgi:GntR family transcriptional regulator
MLNQEVPVPLYFQIELQLRDAIESGRYRAGDRLPTESELRRQYGVSRITVRTALHRLEEDGLVTTKRGRGTFVTSQAGTGGQIERNSSRLMAFDEDLRRTGAELRVDVLAVERLVASHRVAALLEVAPGTAVQRVRRLGWVDNAPLWLESRYVAAEIGDLLAETDLRDTAVTARLEQLAGRPVTHSRLRISAGAATTDQAHQLQVKVGDAVLINEFTVYAGERPLEAARAIFRADRYAFTVEVSNTRESIDRSLRLVGSALGSLSVIRQEVVT